MALVRPVTKTIISTAEFGQPVYDWIVANTPTAWTNLTMQNGWSTYLQGQYRKLGDMVQLRGYIVSPGGSGVMATLPVGFRPLVDVAFYVSPWLAGGVTPNSIGIATSGAITPALAIAGGASFSITGFWFSTL